QTLVTASHACRPSLISAKQTAKHSSFGLRKGVWYHWRKGNIAHLSIMDIKGLAATGNRGLADLVLFKHQLQAAILAKATTMFPNSATWWTNTVGHVADSFKS
ncbi:MAG: hypothetical protein ACKPKO_13685, partial [Candidatus Fonsibacter sp.]